MARRTNSKADSIATTGQDDVTINLFGQDESAMAGRIFERGGDGLSIAIPNPLIVGETVKVDCAEELIVAEVRACKQFASGYHLILEISHRVNKGSLLEAVSEFQIEAT